MAESKVFLLTVLLLLKMELAGLARGILLRLYLTKNIQERANTPAATTRQMMARPQPGIGWSGVTAVVITELVTVLLSVLVLVELDTVEVDDVRVVVIVDVDEIDDVLGLVENELDEVSVLVDSKVSGVVAVDVDGVVEFSRLIVSVIVLILLWFKVESYSSSGFVV